MSTIDTSSWNPNPDLNESLEGIPLTADASVAMTWQAIRCLMAGASGDKLALEALMVPFTGATASADGAQGLVPAPEAGDEDKVLKGDGTWGTVAAANHVHGNITTDGKLGTASRVVVTDSDKLVDVSSVTATELGYLSGVASAVQTQLNGKASDSAVVHLTGDETIAGAKTFTRLLTVDRSSESLAAGNMLHALACKYKNEGRDVDFTSYPISMIGTDASSTLNADVRVGSTTGTTVVTAGESGASICSALGLYNDENLYLTADNEIKIYVKCSNDSTSYAGPVVISGTSASGGTGSTTSISATTFNGALGTGSDERLKTPAHSIPDEVLDAWGDVDWEQFQFLDAVSVKGEKARIHLGLIAQKVKAVFESRGLDACRYSILCLDESGMWMIHYVEALSMEAAHLRRENARLKDRLASLEKRLSRLEGYANA